MRPIALRIESGPCLAFVVMASLVLVPALVALVWRSWSEARHKERRGSFASSFVITLGVELGVLTSLVLLSSNFPASAKLLILASLVVLPAIAGLIRASERPESRAGAFWRTFAAVLGIELAPITVVLLVIGANCFDDYGYVEF